MIDLPSRARFMLMTLANNHPGLGLDIPSPVWQRIVHRIPVRSGTSVTLELLDLLHAIDAGRFGFSINSSDYGDLIEDPYLTWAELDHYQHNAVFLRLNADENAALLGIASQPRGQLERKIHLLALSTLEDPVHCTLIHDPYAEAIVRLEHTPSTTSFSIDSNGFGFIPYRS